VFSNIRIFFNRIIASLFVILYDLLPKGNIAPRIFQTIGGAFGSAIPATVIQHQLSSNAAPDIQAMTGAYNTAFWWSIGFAVRLCYYPCVKMNQRQMKY
jgi:hypothetical protein